jgi:ParB family chromosome partitioning protein
MTKRKKLQGLGAWLGDGGHKFSGSLMDTGQSGTAGANESRFVMLGVERLQRGRYQPRQHFPEDFMAEMAATMQSVGVVEPLVVRPTAKPEQYEILAGEIRWRAAQKAGLAEVPVVVREVDDNAAAAIALIENLQRKELNPIEEATGMQRLKTEFGLSQGEVAGALGKTQSTVSRVLGLLDLEPTVQEFIRAGQLEAGHGKVLLGLSAAEQLQLARQSVGKGWSVRELERRKAELRTPKGRSSINPTDPDMVRLQNRMETRLGAPVQLRYNAASGRGRIEIRFDSLEQCEGLLEKMGVTPADE